MIIVSDSVIIVDSNPLVNGSLDVVTSTMQISSELFISGNLTIDSTSLTISTDSSTPLSVGGCLQLSNVNLTVELSEPPLEGLNEIILASVGSECGAADFTDTRVRAPTKECEEITSLTTAYRNSLLVLVFEFRPRCNVDMAVHLTFISTLWTLYLLPMALILIL